MVFDKRYLLENVFIITTYILCVQSQILEIECLSPALTKTNCQPGVYNHSFSLVNGRVFKKVKMYPRRAY